MKSSPDTEAHSSWDQALLSLSNEIKERQYSPKTLKFYILWAEKLRYFTLHKPPGMLDVEDVKLFLTHLAVERKVGASSHNQAYNALLFFFRNVLHREFGTLEGVMRVKSNPPVPVVLSIEEVKIVLSNLDYPYDLILKVLYCCGLMLSECIKLRVNDLNFDAMILTIYNETRKKKRIIPMPKNLKRELENHFRYIVEKHEQDLAADYAGVFLPSAIERKYPGAAKELVWQWVFPSKELTFVPDTGELRRYHLHETHVQKAIKMAVRKSRLLKRASARTFRHTFASHLLEANVDLSIIKEIMGYSTTIDTHTFLHDMEKKRSAIDNLSQSIKPNKAQAPKTGPALHQLELAEMQLLGFAHASNGYSIKDLVESMGLAQEEWEQIKNKTYLNEKDIEEIDYYFEKRK
ncbi:MAG: integron integrase [Desulforegulaceae bacterium]|nr:integron integrase [Desulforegulaceae bacterium]